MYTPKRKRTSFPTTYTRPGQKVIKQSQIVFVPKRSQRSLLHNASSGPEKKNFDTTGPLTLQAAALWTAPQPLNIITIGSSPSQRVGRKVHMKSISIRWTVTIAANFFPNRIRVLIVYDRQTNGAVPAITDVLAANEFNSHMSLANSQRFVVVTDEYSEQFQSPTLSTHISGKVYKKLNLDEIFGTAVGAISDVETGALFLMVCSDDYAGTGTGTLNYNHRLRFIDN